MYPLLFVTLLSSWEHNGCNWRCNVHFGRIQHASLTQHRGTTLQVSVASWKDQKPGQPGLKLLGLTTQRLFNLTSRNFSFLTWYWQASQVALVVKNPPANSGDLRDAGWIPGSGRSPGGGHSNPLKHSCLENPMDRGAWWGVVHKVTKNQIWPKRLSTLAQRMCLMHDRW